MKKSDKPFVPTGIDEQIEYFDQKEDKTESNAQMVHALRRLYTQKAQEEATSLQQNWQRIVAAQQEIRKQVPVSLSEQRVTRELQMEQSTRQKRGGSLRSRKLQQQLATIVALLAIAFIVGSMVTVLYAARNNGTASNVGSTTVANTLTLLQVTRTNGISNRPLDHWTIKDTKAIQRLYTAIYALSKSPTLQPTPCPMADTSKYHLSFFHNQTLVQKVLVGGCGSLIVIGSDDNRMWTEQFSLLFMQTLGIQMKILP